MSSQYSAKQVQHCQYGETEYLIGSITPGHFFSLTPDIVVELVDQHVSAEIDFLSFQFNFGNARILIKNTDEQCSRSSIFSSGSFVYRIYGIGSRDSKYLKYRIIRCTYY